MRHEVILLLCHNELFYADVDEALCNGANVLDLGKPPRTRVPPVLACQPKTADPFGNARAFAL